MYVLINSSNDWFCYKYTEIIFHNSLLSVLHNNFFDYLKKKINPLHRFSEKLKKIKQHLSRKKSEEN